MRHLAGLLLILLACGDSAPEPMRIETPEGFSFVVPDGFSHESRVQGGTTLHGLRSATAEIAIAPFHSTGPLPGCSEALTTHFGMAGCFTAKTVDDRSASIAILHSGGVGILVVGADLSPRASQIVRAFIDTIEVTPARAGGGVPAPVPSTQVDPQFFGCFTTGSSSALLTFSMTTTYSLCLRKDFSFEYRWVLGSDSYEIGTHDVTNSVGGTDVDRGQWSAERPPGQSATWTLHLSFSDGRQSTWDVRFYKGYLVRGEQEFWERQ